MRQPPCSPCSLSYEGAIPTPSLPTSGEGVISPPPRVGEVGRGMPTPSLPTSGEGVITPPPRRGGGWEGEMPALVRPGAY